MRGSKWILLVVILAIVAVLAAKEAVKERPSGAPTPRPPATTNPDEPPSPPGASAPAPVPSPPAQAKPSSKEKPGGPLPGSKLADCLKSGRPTLADFGKGWCLPCKMMVPVLKQAAQDYWGKANIVFVDMEEYVDLAGQYRIAVMPTQIFFDTKGKEVTRRMGYMDRQEIDRQLSALGVKQ